jgi:hypothetical protein
MSNDPNLHDLAGWEHVALHERVLTAIKIVPKHFKPAARIDGINVADLPTLALAATIEEHTIATLNALRSVWDPARTYAAYSFIRQPQMFPSVRLCRALGSDDIIMGIELSGWNVLAKEGMPNFRFVRTADACAPQDLVVVVPWALSDVTHGAPVAFCPYVASAKRLATVRNDYWKNGRRSETDATIVSPVGVRLYPRKSDGIDDKPAIDANKNFGRIARTCMMDDFIAETKQVVLRDRSIAMWIRDVERLGADRGDLTHAPPEVA